MSPTKHQVPPCRIPLMALIKVSEVLLRQGLLRKASWSCGSWVRALTESGNWDDDNWYESLRLESLLVHCSHEAKAVLFEMDLRPLKRSDYLWWHSLVQMFYTEEAPIDIGIIVCKPSRTIAYFYPSRSSKWTKKNLRFYMWGSLDDMKRERR